MRRLSLILLMLIYLASAGLGASGTWRCANGTRCAFTPGVGFHCPGARCLSMKRTAARTTGGSCPLCHAHPKSITASSPCASVCGKCQCRFEITSSHVPATLSTAIGILSPIAIVQPGVFPMNPVPTMGYITRPIIFTTGPPDLIPAHVSSTGPSRAPPRLLSA